MKPTILKIGFVVITLFLCSMQGLAQRIDNQSSNKVKSVELKVTGMTCAGCASHVHKVLSETAGIVDNEVKYPGDIAVIKYDPIKIQPQEIIQTIEEETNFKAELITKAES